ncbi:MAG: fibronectin type III domain-containing protein [Saprospiraceae bacterium]|nr:fibronectin type III domain-containing protein [Saprospiraceae bacterium]
MPNNNCPTGSTMQYSTDNGLNWTSTIPQYFQSGAPQSIITRCNCNSYKPMSSISSSPVVTSPSSCPANCPCVTPSLQASLILFYNVSTNQFTINWSNGNGSRRVVKINTLNQFTAPANGTDPTANPMFAGFGEQVVYNGSGNSVTVTGLKPNTVYWVRVYEANCESIYSLYNTTVAIQNPNSQQTVLVPPHIQSFTASTVMPQPGGGTQREIFYDNTNVYGVNAPITIAADGSTNTIFTLKASFITGMGFRIVNKQGKIVTNGDLAFDPVRYGRLGVKQVLSQHVGDDVYTSSTR